MGVERAALDSARQMTALSWGGWCPHGRVTEEGEIPSQYFSGNLGCGLEETPSSRPAQRIRMLARDCDAALIFKASSFLPKDVKNAIELLREGKKFYRICDSSKVYTVPRIAQWICEPQSNGKIIEILSVLGPKESASPGIYHQSFQYLTDVFQFVSLYRRYGVKIWDPKQNKKKEQESVD